MGDSRPSDNHRAALGLLQKGPTMNSLNCTNKTIWVQKEVIITYISILLILGILFNVAALWVFCSCMRKKWTETIIYMINLAVSDLCLLCILPIMIYSQTQVERKDTVLCQVSQSIYLINRYMSMSIITIISMDRYVAIQFPMQVKRFRSPSRSAIICAVLWVLVIISVISLNPRTWQLHDSFCFYAQTYKRSKMTIFSLIVFFISLIILTFCSTQVIVILVKKKKTNAHEKKVIQKAIWIISANLLIYLACFLPMHVVLMARLIMTLESCASLYTWKYFIMITSRLSNANCCLDAVCYYFVAKEFQEASAQAISITSKSYKLQNSTQASTD